MGSVPLFVGPSGCGLSPSLLEGIEVLPPAQRGSIDDLIDRSPCAGTLVLCDGSFKSVPAVSHAELCRALDRGWQVYGVSSIGAIRAFELAEEGMQGFGYVYAQFCKHEDFTDDEMCLLHAPEPLYLPLTEALVNVRFALETQGDALGVPETARRDVLTALGALWFGERTFERIRDAMRGAGIAPRTADQLIAWTQRNRVKMLDLRSLLRARPWAASRSVGQRDRQRTVSRQHRA